MAEPSVEMGCAMVPLAAVAVVQQIWEIDGATVARVAHATVVETPEHVARHLPSYVVLSCWSMIPVWASDDLQIDDRGWTR